MSFSKSYKAFGVIIIANNTNFYFIFTLATIFAIHAPSNFLLYLNIIFIVGREEKKK
jgi:hypothetical protein